MGVYDASDTEEPSTSPPPSHTGAHFCLQYYHQNWLCGPRVGRALGAGGNKTVCVHPLTHPHLLTAHDHAHLEVVQEEVLGVEDLQQMLAGLLVHCIHHLLQTWTRHSVKSAVVTWRATGQPWSRGYKQQQQQQHGMSTRAAACVHTYVHTGKRYELNCT